MARAWDFTLEGIREWEWYSRDEIITVDDFF